MCSATGRNCPPYVHVSARWRLFAVAARFIVLSFGLFAVAYTAILIFEPRARTRNIVNV